MRVEAPELDRDALLALLDRMLRAEAVADAPPAAERGEWLYGSAGFTEPDEHGWMAPLPSPELWVPRALVFWRMAILSDAPVSDEQMRDPRHSLARWPAIERAVKAYVVEVYNIPMFATEHDDRGRVCRQSGMNATTMAGIAQLADRHPGDGRNAPCPRILPLSADRQPELSASTVNRIHPTS